MSSGEQPHAEAAVDIPASAFHRDGNVACAVGHYAAADRREVTSLGLLDLSAAFDCVVDQDILVERLQR